MNENREEYQAKITNDFIEKLNIDLDREYSIDEVNEILNKHNLKGTVLKFEPTKPHTGGMIIATLVYMEMIISDAVKKGICLHEQKNSICNK